jgi:hypothetical protein
MRSGLCMTVLAVAASACPGRTRPVGLDDLGTPAARCAIELSATTWTVAGAGAAYHTTEFQHVFTGPDHQLMVEEWPDADEFVQTAAEAHAEARRDDPATTILHQGGADGDILWELVEEQGGEIAGAVLRRGPGLNTMCSFQLLRGRDWTGPLGVCRGLAVGDAPPCT